MKCINCGEEEGRGKNNICRWCWRRQNDEKNRDKIREQHTANYLENKDRRLEQSKEWQRNNKERIADYKREYYKKHREEFIVRQMTRHYFGHLKKTSQCEECNSKDKLEFHHIKPYRYDVFKILCMDCHDKLHHDSFVENHEDHNSRGERAIHQASESISNKRDIGNPDVPREESAPQEEKNGTN